MRNNIFYRNGTGSLRGRGFCALGNNATTIRNNLFFENTIAAVIIRVGGVPMDVSGTVANGLFADDAVDGNFDLDPAFVNEALSDWHLAWGSPAIDAGWPGSPLDPDGTVADVGPFAFDQSLVGVGPGSGVGAAIALRAAPNPAHSGGTTFRVDLAHPATDVTVVVHDARGRRIALIRSGPRGAGAFDVRWDAAGVPAGVYFARVAVDGSAAAARIVILD